MELPSKDFLPAMSLAVSAALAAGERVLSVYRSQFSHTLKSGQEPMTEADTLSDKTIRDILSQSGYPILSEESPDNEARLSQKLVWIVDPLDGTSDFVNRTGEFSIMIALVKAGVPILGVVFRPENDMLYIAQKGQGAYQRQSEVWQTKAVSAVGEMAKARAVVSRHHLTSQEESFIKKLGLGSFIQRGSSGLKIAEVAAGMADLYFTLSDKIKQWDTAAAYCIIKEAGGEMTDMLGRELVYNTQDVYHKNGILVTNGLLHGAVLKIKKGSD